MNKNPKDNQQSKVTTPLSTRRGVGGEASHSRIYSGNNIVHLCNGKKQDEAYKLLSSLPSDAMPMPSLYQLYELSDAQHDGFHLRPCELCAFGSENYDGRWCGPELFMKCLHILGRRTYFLEDTPAARKKASDIIRKRIYDTRKREHIYTQMRDPFDHHDPDYDEHWLENNIDNPTYPDYD